MSNRDLRALAAVVLASCLSTAPLTAQTPDSLRGLIQQGLSALAQHAESGSPEDAARAARLFIDAIREHRDDAWAHYGLGTILFRAPKTMSLVRTRGLADGEAIFVAQRELERALALDPTLAPAAEVLVALCTRTSDTAALSRARDRLRNANGSEEVLAQADMALRDTLELLKRVPRTAQDHLRRAYVLFSRHADVEAAQSYLEGITRWDEAGAKVYIDDALVIATQAEERTLMHGDLVSRAEALKLFWKKRALRDGVSVAERIGEYYRRIAVVREKYGVNHRTAPALDGIMRRRHTPLGDAIDHRGLAYLRYGQPAEQFSFQGPDYVNNETWIYHQPNGEKFYFVFVGDASMRLARDPSEVVQCIGGAELMCIDVWGDLGRIDPRYRLIAAEMLSAHTARFARRADAARAHGENIRQRKSEIAFAARRQADEAMRTDAAPQAFKHSLTVFHDLATFRGNRCTDVVYSLAAKAPNYRVTVTMADTVTWEGQRVDTVVSRDNIGEGYLRSTGTICTQPRAQTYVRFSLSTRPDTGATAGGSIGVPDYSGSSLMLSDLLFATTEPGNFVRGDAHLALVPPRQFRQNEPFRLFYEIYNLALGTKYRTEITLTNQESNPFARLFGGRKKTTVAFDGVATSGDLIQELRTLVPQLEAGKVLVTVKVTDTSRRLVATKSEVMWVLPAREPKQ